MPWDPAALPASAARAAVAARCKREQWRHALQPIPTILDWYRTNAFAGSLLAAGFVVLKGYVLTRGDLATALGILQYQGLVAVVTAGLLSSLPILAAAMLAYTVIHTIESRDVPGLRRPLALVMLGAFVLAVVFTPWASLALAVLIGLVIGFLRARHVHNLVAVPFYVLFGSAGLVAVILSLYTVWVPHEIVTFRPSTLPHGSRVEVGYVLSEDNGWITMLTSGARKIVRYPDAEVMTQMVCERNPSLSDIWSEARVGATLWDEVTYHDSYLHPAVNQNCPY